ncbi:MAG TPA: MaoC family dehydratase [Candidatus Acidoferrum sp.]|nr:MaoC family dehydratase [Candidatus Acidoferrum sp.]
MPPLVIADLKGLKNYVGRELGVTDWLVVTQKRIQQFAEATEDRQWIHLDSERAKIESPYGATIAHGFLTLSLISFLMKQAVQIQSGIRMAVNYGLNRVRFPAAVRAESKIRGRFFLAAIKELPEGIEAVFSVTVESEGAEKPCCVAEWIVRYYH